MRECLTHQGPRERVSHWLCPPSPHRLGRATAPRFLLVIIAATLVHWLTGEAAGEQKAEPSLQPQAGDLGAPVSGPLPGNVADMRDAILSAAVSGHIEELRAAIALNELSPDFGENAGTDPIGYLRGASGDGEGREVLAALADILSLPPARVPGGRDIENSAVYVWPYLAERAPATLTPSEEVQLLRLVSPAAAKEMRERKKWLWWRLSIGADGTWLSFRDLRRS